MFRPIRSIRFAPLLLLLLALPACSDGKRRFFQGPAPLTRDVSSVYALLKTNYLYPDKIPADPSAFATVDDLIKALNDPFTFELSPASAAQNTQGTVQGQFGFSIARLSTFVYVSAIDPAGPAYAAGLRRNDIVRSIGTLTLTPTTTDAELVSALAPQSITMTVTRGPATSLNLSLTRANFTSASVEEVSIDTLTHYVRIGHFVDTSVDPLGPTGELGAILNRNPTKTRWVIDLRWNTGGFLHRACEVADFFVPSGRLLTMKDKNGVTFFSFDAAAGGAGEGRSLVVLQNGQSASSSEVLAAAVRALVGAKIAGEKSFGKGVSQRVYAYPDGGQLLLVSFQLFDPLGGTWHTTGITPDATVALDPQKLQDGVDSQLEGALSLLGGGVAAPITAQPPVSQPRAVPLAAELSGF